MPTSVVGVNCPAGIAVPKQHTAYVISVTFTVSSCFGSVRAVKLILSYYEIQTQKKVQTNAYLTRTHCMQIVGEIPFVKPQNDA